MARPRAWLDVRWRNRSAYASFDATIPWFSVVFAWGGCQSIPDYRICCEIIFSCPEVRVLATWMCSGPYNCDITMVNPLIRQVITPIPMASNQILSGGCASKYTVDPMSLPVSCFNRQFLQEVKDVHSTQQRDVPK